MSRMGPAKVTPRLPPSTPQQAYTFLCGNQGAGIFHPTHKAVCMTCALYTHSPFFRWIPCPVGALVSGPLQPKHPNPLGQTASACAAPYVHCAFDVAWVLHSTAGAQSQVQLAAWF